MATNQSRFGQLLGAVNSIVGATRSSERHLRGTTPAVRKIVFAAFSEFFLRQRRDIPDVANQEKFPVGLAVGELETFLRAATTGNLDEDALKAIALVAPIDYDPSNTSETPPGTLQRVIDLIQDAIPAHSENPFKPADADITQKIYPKPDARLLGTFLTYLLQGAAADKFKGKVINALAGRIASGTLSREDVDKAGAEMGYFNEGLGKAVEYAEVDLQGRKIEKIKPEEPGGLKVSQIVPLLDEVEKDDEDKDRKDQNGHVIPVVAYIHRNQKVLPPVRVFVRESRIFQLAKALRYQGINIPEPLGGAIAAKIMRGEVLTDPERLEYARILREGQEFEWVYGNEPKPGQSDDRVTVKLKLNAYERFLLTLASWEYKAEHNKRFGDAQLLLWMGAEATWAGISHNALRDDISTALLNVADHFTLIRDRDRKKPRGDYGRKEALTLLGKGLFSHLPDEIKNKDLPQGWSNFQEEGQRLFHIWNPTRVDREEWLLRDADLFDLHMLTFNLYTGLPVDGKEAAKLVSSGAGWGWYKNRQGQPSPDEFAIKLLRLGQIANERNANLEFERKAALSDLNPGDPKQRDFVRDMVVKGEVRPSYAHRDDAPFIDRMTSRTNESLRGFQEALPDLLEETLGDLAKEVG